MNEKLYVTDKEGNIIDTIDGKDKYVKLSDGDKVIRKGVIQYLEDTVPMKYHFVKINPFCFAEVVKKYTMLSYLFPYMGYMDNKLQYKNGRPIKVKDLPKITGFSATTVNIQMRKLKEDDVIRKIKYGKYTYLVINPYICYIGSRIYMSLYEEFKLSSWRMYCEESGK